MILLSALLVGGCDQLGFGPGSSYLGTYTRVTENVHAHIVYRERMIITRDGDGFKVTLGGNDPQIAPATHTAVYRDDRLCINDMTKYADDCTAITKSYDRRVNTTWGDFIKDG